MPNGLTGHVDVDQVGTSTTTFASVTSTTSTVLTVGPNATALAIFLLFSNGTPASPAVTWDSGGTNQSMINIDSGQMSLDRYICLDWCSPHQETKQYPRHGRAPEAAN